MNCFAVRPLLPAYLYGGLQSQERSQLEAHLAQCAECRREHDALARVGKLLDATPAPIVTIDVGAIHAKALRREVRRVKRWRRFAVAAGLAASLLLVLSLCRLDLSFERHQVTLRWGKAPEPTPAPTTATIVKVEPRENDIEERLQLLDQLAHALALDVQTRDLKQQEAVALLQAQLTQVVNETLRIRTAGEQDVSTLTRYLDAVLKEKGVQP
jgi:hypothetical protein